MRWSVLALWACSVPALMAQGTMSKEEVRVRKLLANNKPYKAITRCDHMLLEGRVHPEFFVLRADALNRIGQAAKAEPDARAALQHAPASAEALLQLAVAEQGQGRYDSADVHFRKVLAQGPSADVRYRLAVNHRLARRCPQAVEELDEALKAGPGDAAGSARILRVKGECLAEMGDSTAARAALNAAVAADPKDPVNYNSRGYYGHAFFGDHLGAIADYDRAIKINPNYSYAFNNRGWSWYKLGQKDKALKDIGRAKNKKVFNPYVYRNLGVIALESGDTAKACMEFRRALDYDFTALFGREVEELMAAHCQGEQNTAAPVQAPNAPMDRNAPKAPNAPDKPAPRTNAP
ncbi:MAG: tetratricopeptide repeat protein [Flavobacteriales bacterium]